MIADMRMRADEAGTNELALRLDDLIGDAGPGPAHVNNAVAPINDDAVFEDAMAAVLPGDDRAAANDGGGGCQCHRGSSRSARTSSRRQPQLTLAPTSRASSPA